MLFIKEAARLYTKAGKHKLHISASSLRSETHHFSLKRWRTLHAFVHIQVFKINLCMYLVRLTWSSKSFRFGVKIKACLQPLFSIILGWDRREERLSRSELNQPFRSDSEAVPASHELNCLNSIRLIWTTVYEPGLKRAAATDFFVFSLLLSGPCEHVLWSVQDQEASKRISVRYNDGEMRSRPFALSQGKCCNLDSPSLEAELQ